MALTAWRTFVTVCRLGSLSAAAAELGYTQSAVSRQIAALEREVDAPLVERHARGIRPTAAGEAFRHHAQVTVNEAERAIRAARDARDGSPARPLAVGATPSLAAGLVPAAMRRLLDENGPLPWTLVPALTSELYERTVSAELDMAVVTDAPPGLPNDPRVERHFLGTDEMVVVVPAGHRLAGSGRVPITALADATWAEDNEGSAALLRKHAARAGVTARIDLHAADLPGKIALVATGHAIALTPGVLATTLRPDVTTLSLLDPPTRGIYAILPCRDPHPSAQPLVGQLMVSFRLARPVRLRRGPRALAAGRRFTSKLSQPPAQALLGDRQHLGRGQFSRPVDENERPVQTARGTRAGSGSPLP